MENVKGLTSARVKHVPWDERNKKDLSPEEQKGSAFQIVLDEFDKLNYKVVHSVLDAVYYGVPQFRERLIMIGSRDHEDIFLPIATHFQTHQDEQFKWVSLRDAIEHLEDEESECAQFSQERLKYLKLVPEGGYWKDLPDHLIEKAMGGAYESDGGKTGFYRRLAYDEPAPTLVGSPVHKGTMLCHPRKNRPLSVNEYLAIQQFPDGYRLSGTLAKKYQQVGNAVPVGLGRAIGKAIMSVAEGRHKVEVKRTVSNKHCVTPHSASA
jgi:DNA (cytosine-5)-methyltransferase 1